MRGTFGDEDGVEVETGCFPDVAPVDVFVTAGDSQHSGQHPQAGVVVTIVLARRFES
jgi:hypothetical protein